LKIPIHREEVINIKTKVKTAATPTSHRPANPPQTCLPYSAQTSQLTTQSWLYTLVPMRHLRKTKPIPARREPTQPLLLQRITNKNHPTHREKTNPIKPNTHLPMRQSRRSPRRSRIPPPLGSLTHSLIYPFTHLLIHHPTSDIPHTTYDIRNPTLPIARESGIIQPLKNPVLQRITL